MKSVIERIENINWKQKSDELHNNGYVLMQSILNTKECGELIGSYKDNELFRKTISMERYRFGAGEYKYYRYPLPSILQQIRETVYPHLAEVANKWMSELNIETNYPDEFKKFQQLSKKNNQVHPTVLILKYGEGGHNTLHQDLYGPFFFPIQLVLFLNKSGEDYTGGEFVLTEQIPRAQSKAIVLNPGIGDMLLFTTNFRPVKGSRGYYRVNMKHGVSEVKTGSRHTLGIIFHDAEK